jgi:hypothetical protein
MGANGPLLQRTMSHGSHRGAAHPLATRDLPRVHSGAGALGRNAAWRLVGASMRIRLIY